MKVKAEEPSAKKRKSEYRAAVAKLPGDTSLVKDLYISDFTFCI